MKRKKPTNKAQGRKYTEADLASNRRHQKRRVELNREARKRGIYGKRRAMKKDLSHTTNNGMVLEDRSKNRSRNGKDGKSTKKKARRRKVA